jgi:hypothetical protein
MQREQIGDSGLRVSSRASAIKPVSDTNTPRECGSWSQKRGAMHPYFDSSPLDFAAVTRIARANPRPTPLVQEEKGLYSKYSSLELGGF